jgi:outer membrane lipoprotein SlyB
MKKLFVILISILYCNTVIAETLNYKSKVIGSNCKIHSKESNTAAAVAGGVIGAVAGNYVGKKLFKSKYVSTAMGAGAGLIIGNEIGSKETYSCTISFKNLNNIIVQQSVLGKEYKVNDIISVQESNNLFFIQ